MKVSPKFNPPSFEKPGYASQTFQVEAAGGGQLKLIGELDIVAVPELEAWLAATDGDIELDCSQLTFIDCSGLRVLEEAQRACDAEGVRLRLIAPSRCVTRLLTLAGLDGFFEIHDGFGS